MALLKEKRHTNLFSTFPANPKCGGNCVHHCLTQEIYVLPLTVCLSCLNVRDLLMLHSAHAAQVAGKEAELQRLTKPQAHAAPQVMETGASQGALSPGRDRPDHVARSFHLRLQQLLKERMCMG
jgi:hypothetical protein